MINPFKSIFFYIIATSILLALSAFHLNETVEKAFLPISPVEVWANSKIQSGYYFMTPLNRQKRKDVLKKSMLSILDESGHLLYYKQLLLASDFKLHGNGQMSYFNSGVFYVMNSNFKVVDSVKCIGNVKTDSHDFLILPNGNYMLIGKKHVIEDFSNKPIFLRRKVAGSKRALAKYDIIQELNKAKKVVFEWDSRGVYSIDDINSFYLNDTSIVDVTHFNSIDVDNNGNILISVRFFDEVAKVRKADGLVLWRMGGKRNQIKVINDSTPFLGQHDARFSGAKRFTLFDNGYGYDSLGHSPRGIEYEVDDVSKTAKIIWKHVSEFPMVCSSAGNLQRLSDGNLLIGYGKQDNAGNKLAVEIIDSTGKTQARCWYGDSLFTYRTFFYKKIPFTIERPEINILSLKNKHILSTTKKYKFYRWSNGKTSSSIVEIKPGRYFVDVSNDGESYFRAYWQGL